MLNSGHESARRLTVYDVLFTIRSARVGRPGLDGSRVSRGNVDGRTMRSHCVLASPHRGLNPSFILKVYSGL